jgi:hypothetical protein
MQTWRDLYSAAVLETDPDQLRLRIKDATNAMFRRDEELDHSPDAHQEREEMAHASEALLVLETDYQTWNEHQANS